MAVSSGQVTVNRSGVLIVPGDYDGAMVTLINNGSQTVYIGPSDVSTSSGYPLLQGETIDLELGPDEEIWGIVPSNTAVVGYLATKNE